MTVRSKTLQPKLWDQKAPEYIQEARILNVEIHPPSINASDLDFTIVNDDIYFGLNAIRDVGKTAARTIVRARGKTPYQDVYDFLNRVNLQKVTTKTFTSLVKAGAFDKLGYNRQELTENTQELYNYIRDIVEYEQRKIDIVARDTENEKATIIIDKRNLLRKELKRTEKELKKDPDNKELLSSKLSIEEELFPIEEMNIRRKPKLKPKTTPVQPELNRSEEVELAIQDIMSQGHYIGCYIDTHPAKLINQGCEKLSNLYQGQRATVCGVINSLRVIRTRKGQQMAFMEIDDSTANAEVTIFPRVFSRIKEDIAVGKLVHVKIRTEKEEPTIKLIADLVQVYKE